MKKIPVQFGNFPFSFVVGSKGSYAQGKPIALKEQVSTSVPNSASAPFATPVLLVGECLPQALLMRLMLPYILPPHFTIAENKTGCGSPALIVISERS